MKILQGLKNFFLGKKGTNIFFRLIRLIFILALLGIALVTAVVIYYSSDLPLPEKFTEKPFTQSTKIFDRTGKVLLYDIYGEERRAYVPLSAISDNLKNAVLATEDARFYQHGAIDIRGIIRAILVDLKFQSPSQGASTITQQLIRSALLTGQKTVDRKIKEIILSFELEDKYSKDQILEWYLNQVPFGSNAYGAEAASQTYFNKPASDLTIPEAASMAAMLSSPSALSPYGSKKAKLLTRKDYVLNRMHDEGFITDQQLQDSLKQELVFLDNKTLIKAPHFVFYVLDELKNELQYDDTYLQEKGLKVYTTLNWDVQQNVEDVVRGSTQETASANANNTAAVVLDPRNGEILGLVGSKDYFGTSYPAGCNSEKGECLFDPQYDVATIGKRQPGSSFKPIVYAEAFEKGYTPSTLMWDTPTEFNPLCPPVTDAGIIIPPPTDNSQNPPIINNPQIIQPNGTTTSLITIGPETDSNGGKCYSPKDYDETTRGRLTLRQAIDQSLNIPSVKLLYLVGVPDALKLAQEMGITTLTDPSRYGLSLVLGGGEVNLLELASAYGSFPAEGLRYPPVGILKIEDVNGNIIYQNNKTPSRVLSVQTAREMNDVLSDNEARVPVFARNNALYFPGYQVAAKTGTTSSYVDVWTLGYTPFAVVGVWAGNNDNSPINKKTGLGLAAPIWRKIMTNLLTTNPIQNFTKPDVVLPDKPILRGESIPNEYHDILYYVNKDDPLGAQPSDPNTDQQYKNWEAGVQYWLSQHPGQTGYK